MTTNVIPFDFHSKTVRVVNTDPNHPLFVAYDVAKALGYKQSRQAISQHCKGDVKRVPLKTAGGLQSVIVINEANLYRLIFGSKLESAVAFQDWVFEEVLPTIRQTGKYEIPKVETLTPAQQRHIQNRVAQLVREQVGTTYKMIWAQIKNHFKVGSYKDIPAARYPDVCAYLKCQPIFLSKTEDEQLFLDDLSAEHSAELKKALESQGIERLLVVIEKGRLALVKNIQGFSIVDAQGYRTVRRNMQMLNKQFNWLSGDEGMESLDLELESIH